MSSQKVVSVKNIKIGGTSPISVQSMCSLPFTRFDELLKQALSLQAAGCDILRVAVPDMPSVKGFALLKEKLNIPLVADIHFDYRLAIESIYAGADKIRINPGNTDRAHIKDIVSAALNHKIPIRVGINAGSLEKDIISQYGFTPEGLCKSALSNVKLIEDCGYEEIVVSIKASDVRLTVEAYRMFAKQSPYPLHLGITEAGTLKTGLIKSTLGIGTLLMEGIGDTIRVSLTADPLEEIYAAKTILRSLNLGKEGLEVISCPTCGRTTVDTLTLTSAIENEFSYIKKPIKIAVMGCVVNGPGEARQADFGVTGANGEYVLFSKEKIIRHISEDKIMDLIRVELEALTNE